MIHARIGTRLRKSGRTPERLADLVSCLRSRVPDRPRSNERGMLDDGNLVAIDAGGRPAPGGPEARAQTQKQAQRFPAFDPERIFMLGDADLDGRLSLDEYRDFLRSSPRMRNAAATIEPMFHRLDVDRDGFLSLAEYRKSFPRRPSGTPAQGATHRRRSRRPRRLPMSVSRPSRNGFSKRRSGPSS